MNIMGMFQVHADSIIIGPRGAHLYQNDRTRAARAAGATQWGCPVTRPSQQPCAAGQPPGCLARALVEGCCTSVCVSMILTYNASGCHAYMRVHRISMGDALDFSTRLDPGVGSMPDTRYSTI